MTVLSIRRAVLALLLFGCLLLPPAVSSVRADGCTSSTTVICTG